MGIVVLQGLIGSGKDTVSQLLLKKYGGVQMSFASILKDVVSIMFDWDRSMLEGDTEVSREWREKIDEWWSQRLNIPHLTPRFVLQYIGTDVMRGSFHPDIWIACLERRILTQINLLGETEMIVITDCRFSNEIECLKKMGAIFVRVIRGDEPEWLFQYVNYGVPPVGVHISEYGWTGGKFDHVIHNDGTLKELELKIDSLNLFESGLLIETDKLECNLIGF